jgi:uncharacterized protein (DUF1501 family)
MTPPWTASDTALREPGGPTRRRFLQGLVVAGGVTAAGLPSWMLEQAAATTPLGPDEGALVVVNLKGGNDGLNTLAPLTGTARSRYQALRPQLAYPVEDLLPIGDGSWGLNPSLAHVAEAYAAGTVAILQSVGTNGNMSHFDTTAIMQAGTSTTSRATGWMGRYADGLTDWDLGFREVAVGGVTPLSLRGKRAVVTALSSGQLWGSDSSMPWERDTYDALRAMAASPTGLGAQADAVAQATKGALDRADEVKTLYDGFDATTAPLVRDLTLAARVLNADLGTRCITVERDDFDTHALQLVNHAVLLAELDAGLARFFDELAPALRRRTAVLVASEFGRRPAQNGSHGTDHGSAGLALLVGPNVRGGLYGPSPSLTTFDTNGNLVPKVDIRSVYASLLGPWLGADARSVLGTGYADLKLFRAGPGVVPA